MDKDSPKVEKPNIIIASDHAGYALKKRLYTRLTELGHIVSDKGTESEESCDYPDYAHELALGVLSNEDSLGILICGSANGVAMAANKHQGIRAAIAWLPELAELARTHNDANVICLPARFIDDDQADAIVDAFLGSTFEGGRHARRANKIDISAS